MRPRRVDGPVVVAGGRRLRFPALVLGLVLLLTGCMEVNLGVDLRQNGTSVFTVEMVVQEELVQFMEMAGQRVDEKSVRNEFLGSVPGNVRDRVDVSVKRSDGVVRIGLHVRFESIEELTTTMVQGLANGPLFEKFDLTEESDRWVFSAVPVDLSGTLDPDVGAGTTEGVPGDDVFGAMFEDPKTSFSITFPGVVIDSNAASVDGRTARWELEGNGPTTITATARTGSALNKLLVVGVVVLVALVVLAGIVVVRRSRSRRGSVTPPQVPPPGASAATTATRSPWAAPPGAPGSGWPSGPPLAPPAPPSYSQPSASDEGPPSPWSDMTPAPSSATVPELSGPTVPVEPPAPPAPPSVEPVTGSGPAIPEAGWYPDPWGEASWRWHDGTDWTNQTG